ncbi:MAG: hypothetical protein GY754_16830 [bacterium]|nr:hypothetical protein [bacterium]
MIAAAHAWYYAKMTNRTLIISWRPSRYLRDKTANAFSYFFTVPEDISGVPVVVEPRSRLKPFHLLFREIQPLSKEREHWMNGLVEEGKDVRNRYLCFNECFYSLLMSQDKIKPFFDALKLQSEFQIKVDTFAREHFYNKKVIGVHVRYYSPNLLFSNHTPHWYNTEQGLNKIKKMLDKAIKKIEAYDYIIFLATDAALVQDFFKTNYDKVISYDKLFGDSDTLELHDELPVETAEATVVDMFLLARSDILIRFPPTGSWFSYYASLYADEVIQDIST